MYSMPRKNVIKSYAADRNYHIYTRGINKQETFVDAQDYGYFISLFKRYLSPEAEVTESRHGLYPNYSNAIDLSAFCLMSNHVHLLIFQREERAMTNLMRSIITSYTMYFNKKYKRSGSLFESPFKASLVDKDSYLHHISRYIHLNPKNNWQNHPHTSIGYFLGAKKATWLDTSHVLELFDDPKEYLDFVKDYEENKQILDELKWELANDV